MIIGCFFEGLPVDSVDMRLRLSALTRILAPRKEHKLIKLLGAPIRNGEIDYETVTNDVIGDMQMAREMLGEMPELVSQLMRTGIGVEVKQLYWTDVQVFNLIEMLTTDPEPWVLMNFSCFLVFSPRLAELAIVNRARYSNISDTMTIIMSCVEACVQLGLDPKSVLYEASRNLGDVLIDMCASVVRGRV